VKASDREALFLEWIEEYERILFKMVRAYAVDRSDQDDLFQEIALQLWLSIPSFEGRSKASTWIYKVALNTAFVWRRKEGKHRSRSEISMENSEESAPGPNPAKAAERREDLAWLYEELRSLDKIDRSIALLYLDDVSYRDMAEILGLSESNIGVRVHRLKKQLAEGYARRTK
jgi:RNA polymerase sigma-70 factor (ECF subfamily)